MQNNDQSSDNDLGNFVREVTEHAVIHTIAHAVAGPAGGFFAGLLHTGLLNENEDRLLAQHNSAVLAPAKTSAQGHVQDTQKTDNTPRP